MTSWKGKINFTVDVMYAFEAAIHTSVERPLFVFAKETSFLIGISINITISFWSMRRAIKPGIVIDPPTKRLVLIDKPAPTSISVSDCFTSLPQRFAATQHTAIKTPQRHLDISFLCT